jgi:hypothetical protein
MSRGGKRCTDKRAYPTQIAAFKSLGAMRSKGRAERRIYRCQHCRAWHLTCAPLRLPPVGPWPEAPAGIA